MNGVSVVDDVYFTNHHIPYVGFRVSDFNNSQNDGVYSPSQSLVVRYTYFQDGDEVYTAVLQPSGIGGAIDEYVLPLVEERLGVGWFLTDDSVVHKLEVEVEDLAGNVRTKDYSWKVHYFAEADIAAARVLGRYDHLSIADLESQPSNAAVFTYRIQNKNWFPIAVDGTGLGNTQVKHEYYAGTRENRIRKIRPILYGGNVRGYSTLWKYGQPRPGDVRHQSLY